MGMDKWTWALVHGRANSSLYLLAQLHTWGFSPGAVRTSMGILDDA